VDRRRADEGPRRTRSPSVARAAQLPPRFKHSAPRAPFPARFRGRGGGSGRRSCSSRTRPRRRFFRPACFLTSRRRSRLARVGFVFVRRFSGRAALAIRWARRSRASARFCSRLRWRWARRTISPSAVRRVPASPIRRARTGSGRDGERRASKRSRAHEAVLFTFCPPGPGERTKVSSISSAGITIPGAGRKGPRGASSAGAVTAPAAAGGSAGWPAPGRGPRRSGGRPCARRRSPGAARRTPPPAPAPRATPAAARRAPGPGRRRR